MTINLTEWQQSELLELDAQSKIVESKKQFLLKAILDFHRVDSSQVTGMALTNNELTVTVKENQIISNGSN